MQLNILQIEAVDLHKVYILYSTLSLHMISHFEKCDILDIRSNVKCGYIQLNIGIEFTRHILFCLIPE